MKSRFAMDNVKQLFYHGSPVRVVTDNSSPMDYARAYAKESCIANSDDPFYVCDMGHFLRKHEEWANAMPRVHPYYAVKCNNNTVLLNILAQLGCNFDCASKAEIDQVMAMGVQPNRIIFANPCKTASHIRHAAAMGVRMMTFDNEMELQKVKRLFPSAEMVLRIAVSDPTAVCQLNMKFGVDPTSGAVSLLKMAAGMGVAVVGISFHVGSGARDPTAFGIGIAHARRLFDIGRDLGHKMDVLDLGGGYPGYANKDITFHHIAETINAALAVHFPSDYDAHIIAEPGRYYSAGAFLLCTNIIAKSSVPANKISGQESDMNQTAFMYYMNDGVYGSFNCILFDHVTPVGKPLFNPKDAKESWCSLWGPTCDSMDCVYPSYKFPEMTIGDWLVFEDMGAYTMAAGSDFNGFQKPGCHYIITSSDWKVLCKLLNYEECDSGCMSDDSGMPVTSDDETCSVASSLPDYFSSCDSLVNLEAAEKCKLAA